MFFNYQKIVVKVGSNVITRSNGLPNTERIAQLVTQIAQLKKKGIEVILVSSGAVASGRSLIKPQGKQDAVASRQLLAAIGQVKLINTYKKYFAEHQQLCAQVLVTKEDFRDRVHYLNMKNCINILLENGVIPVVNENDVVAVTELMFTDNDELAGLIAAMMNADSLFILSNVDGIYDGDPKQEGSKVITKVNQATPQLSSYISTGKSEFGRGGMLTKCAIALKVAKLGIQVHIMNGTTDDILLKVLADKAVHTHFEAQHQKSETKKWIANAETAATGEVVLNQGAKTVISSGKAASLLPVGIIAVRGNFKTGDIIKLLDEEQQLIGLGLAKYGSDKARERLGQKNQRPLVHYDYLYTIN